MHRPILSDVENDHCGKIREKNKPMMEKKRRARINKCLSQFKQMLIQDEHKNSASHSKWEKADILEMTVEYLKNLRSQLKTLPAPEDKTTPEPCSSTVVASPSIPSSTPYSFPMPTTVPAVPAIQQYLTYQQLVQLSMYNCIQNSLWNSGVFNQYYQPNSSNNNIVENEPENVEK